MDKNNLNEVFNTDFNIFNIISLRYDWAPEAKTIRYDKAREINSLFMMTSHSATYTLSDGTKNTLKPGEIILLPKGSRYSLHYCAPKDERIRPLMISFDISDVKGNEIRLGTDIIKLTEDDGKHKVLFKEVCEYYKDNNYTMVKSKTYELLSIIFPLFEEDVCLINYVNRHITSSLCIPQLAMRCNMSETAYRKKFKEITGLSPVRYITKLKIKKACQMLIYSNTKPDDISDFLNFSSPSYFYRVFKEHMKMTPKEYINSMQKIG